ncbi:MAG: ABC transporter ATP-binding protein, partial [Candidatus Faecousia sp.]|nr:ABC transporter ATP-binding protein [Candidatus Faecousia sp.]
IAAREWVECAIDEYEGALLFVSHDRYFVDKFATRIWELSDGRIRDYLCGYGKYLDLKANAAIRPVAQMAKPEKKPKAAPKADAKALEKEVRRLEREIERQEQAVAELERQMEAAATDYQQLMRLTQEKQAADAELEHLMEQWESAAAEL